MTTSDLRKLLREKAKDSPKYWGWILAWMDRATSDYANVQALALWFGAILTGATAVTYARTFKSIEFMTEKVLPSSSVALFIASPLFILLAWWLVDRYAPEASGSGIPQVMTAIETDYTGSHVSFVDRLLSARTMIVKIASSLLCVAGGGAVGREGPTLQVSASIFHLVGKVVRKFDPKSDERTWVIAGAAAGLASAFNTPLGGIVYAIEELGMQHFRRVRTALLSAVIISGLVAQTLIGSYLYLGLPNLEPVSAEQWPIVLLVGALAGLAGAFFSKSLLWFSRRRKKIRDRRGRALVALSCGLVVAFIVYLQPLARGSGAELISDILFKNQVATAWLTLSRALATMVAYLSGSAGGIFSPSLAIGSCIGSEIGFVFHAGNTNLFAMLGMIGFLTGVTHTPFTSFILVMEMSDRHSAIFPMMVTALIANSLARSVNRHSFYESTKEDLMSAEATPRSPSELAHAATS